MPTDRKIEDQDNAIEDLKGVVDCMLKSIIVAATVSGGQSQRVVKNILQQKWSQTNSYRRFQKREGAWKKS